MWTKWLAAVVLTCCSSPLQNRGPTCPLYKTEEMIIMRLVGLQRNQYFSWTTARPMILGWGDFIPVQPSLITWFALQTATYENFGNELILAATLFWELHGAVLENSDNWLGSWIWNCQLGLWWSIVLGPRLMSSDEPTFSPSLMSSSHFSCW